MSFNQEQTDAIAETLKKIGLSCDWEQEQLVIEIAEEFATMLQEDSTRFNPFTFLDTVRKGWADD